MNTGELFNKLLSMPMNKYQNVYIKDASGVTYHITDVEVDNDGDLIFMTDEKFGD